MERRVFWVNLQPGWMKLPSTQMVLSGQRFPKLTLPNFTQKATLMRMGILLWILYLTSLNMMNVQKVLLFNSQPAYPLLKYRASSNFKKPSLSDPSVALASEVMFLFIWNWAVRGLPIPLLCVCIITLQETNISPKNGILKMMFLFPRWDMLIPWRVYIYNCTLGYTLKTEVAVEASLKRSFWYRLCQVNKRQLGACLPKIKVLFFVWGVGEWTLIS